MNFRNFLLASCIAVSVSGCAATQQAASPLDKIDHFVIVFLENRSFDSMFGLMPGVNGLSAPGAAIPQTDEKGKAYKTLPPVVKLEYKKPDVVDDRFPADLPNAPFDIARYVAINDKTGDISHRFYLNQEQINGGKNDKFALLSEAKGLVMGYYDSSDTFQGRLAKEFVIADNYYQGAFGGSFFNHMWFVCACAPQYPNAPAHLKSVLDKKTGKAIKEKALTPDGYAVNTIDALYWQSVLKKKTEDLLPPQTMPNIGDRLSEKGVSWAWYSGGYNNAMAGKPSDVFQFHHQPFTYFKDYARGTQANKEHLKDYVDLDKAIETNNLPAVAFYKPVGILNQHPGYSEIASADKHLEELIGKLRKSPQWARTAVIITSDEYGGSFDHVAPPKIDRWGPGTRISAIVASPHAKRGYVDHTEYNASSVLATLERRFGLKPLTERDAKAADLGNAFTP
jgi:phospholipase C